MTRDTLPQLIETEVPPHVRFDTIDTFDFNDLVFDSRITGFSFLPDEGGAARPNTTRVAQPSEFIAFGLSPNERSSWYVAVAALTAAGLDREQTYRALGANGEGAFPTLDVTYEQLGMQNFSHDDPSSWAPAVKAINHSYETGILQVRHLLNMPVAESFQRLKLRDLTRKVGSALHTKQPEDLYQDMEKLGSLLSVPAIATIGLSKVLRIVTAPSRMETKEPHVERLVAAIKENGVCSIMGSLGAIVSSDFNGKLGGIAAETMTMAALGLSPADMTHTYPYYTEHSIIALDVYKNALKMLELPPKLNPVNTVTELVREGYTQFTVTEKQDVSALTDDTLQLAILTLLPAGMTNKQLIELIKHNVPEFEKLDEEEVKRARVGLHEATNTTNMRSLNFYLFARGIIDKDDIYDVDTTHPRGNIARLHRKLGIHN